MPLPARKLLSLVALLLAVAGCQTHDRVIYRHPLPWKTHAAAPQRTDAASTAAPVVAPAPPAPVLGLPVGN